MFGKLSRFFASYPGIILTGIVIGILAPLLQKLGNPPNMGVCVACFERDIAGALGLHQVAVVQYIRPEILGLVLGSMIAALLFGEFKARAGSAPMVRFFLGIFTMIGALTFLGCSWRGLLRLAGGDFNAVLGLAGLTVGIIIGVQFLKCGYTLGRSQKTHATVGWIMPSFMIGLLLLLIFSPKFGQNNAIFFSEKGPGSMHAPLLISLSAGLFIGMLAQRTRFCTVGAIRNVILMRDTYLLSGVGALLITAFLTNYFIFEQVHFGFTPQPLAHSDHLWNFLGMGLVGLAVTLAGGCPGRQLFLAGEGDSDAGLFVLGMLVGAGIAHNFALVAKPDTVVNGVMQVGGASPTGMIAVTFGIIVCIIIGFTMREKV